MIMEYFSIYLCLSSFFHQCLIVYICLSPPWLHLFLGVLFSVLGYWRIFHSMFHLLLGVPELLAPPAFFTECIQSFQIYSRPVELDIFSQNEFQLMNLPLWNPIFYCFSLLVFFFFSFP